MCSVMSKSLQPYGLWPGRLLCPWNFPSKNTGVGCSFPPPGDLPNPGIELTSLASPAFAGWFFTTSTIWEAQKTTYKESNTKKKSQSQSVYKHDWGTKKASSQKKKREGSQLRPQLGIGINRGIALLSDSFCFHHLTFKKDLHQYLFSPTKRNSKNFHFYEKSCYSTNVGLSQKQNGIKQLLESGGIIFISCHVCL